ncbi:MAG: glycosyltransferase family 4 protein [Micavibrio sp.]
MDNAVGGAERVLAYISGVLADRGHDIILLTFDRTDGNSFYPLDNRIRRICLNIGDATKQATLGEIAPRIFALRKTILHEKPDVVVSFMHSMFVPVIFSLIGTGIKVIASEHIVPQHYKSRRLEFFFMGLSALMVKSITVLSYPVRDLYPSFIRRRMVVMPNPVHMTNQRAEPAGQNDVKKIILNVGRLDPQKDQKTLIAAFAKLSDRYPDWRLRIVGEGVLRSDLEKQIKDLGLEHRVDLPGVIGNISQEYSKAHIFALPSLYESFGLATAEAMSFGLPVIGFADCPGTNELIINGENGTLVKTHNSSALAEGLEELIKSPDLRIRYGNKGLSSLSQFHPDRIADLWENLIKTTAA